MKHPHVLLLAGLVATGASADNPLELPPSVWLISAAGVSAVVAGGVLVGDQKLPHVALQSASGLLMGVALGGVLGGGLIGLNCAIADYCRGIPPGMVLIATTLGLMQGNHLGIKLHSRWSGVPGNEKASQVGVFLGTLTGVVLAVALWPEPETERYQRRNMLVPIAIIFPNLGGVLGFNMKVGGSPGSGAREGAPNLGLNLEKTF